MKENSYKKNYVYNLLYSVLTMLLPLLTTPYISRVIGASGLGVYSYNYTIAGYFSTFALLGINFYGNREIAKIRDDIDKRNVIFSEIYTMQLITSISILALYGIYLACFTNEDRLIAIIMLFHVISPAFSINWFFSGMEMFKITVIRNIIIKILTVLSIFLFVKSKVDLWIYALIMSLGTLLSEGYLILLVPRYAKYHIPSIKAILTHFKPNIILFVPILSVSVYRSMDKLMLKWLVDYEQVGYYTNAEKIINVCLACVTALGQVMLPKMTNLLSNGMREQFYSLLSKSFKYVNIITIAMMFGLFSVADVFVPVFFGSGYEACILLIKLLSINLVFLSWGNVLKTQYLIPRERDSLYIKSVMFGAIINFGLNILLIPILKAQGATIATICAEFISLIIIIYHLRKEIKIVKDIRSAIPYIVFGFSMYCIVSSISFQSLGILLNLIIRIFIGVLLYTITCVVYWKIINDEFYNIIKNILRKLHH